MDYELYFWCLIAFVVGRVSKDFKFYIGPDEAKYKDSTIGILLKR